MDTLILIILFSKLLMKSRLRSGIVFFIIKLCNFLNWTFQDQISENKALKTIFLESAKTAFYVNYMATYYNDVIQNEI